MKRRPSKNAPPDASAHEPACGCNEYRQLSMSRRSLLRWSGLGLSGALVSGLGPGWLPRVAYADSHTSDRDILVSLFLRGGADALSLCAPYLDPDYRRARPTLALLPPDAQGASRALDLDGRFGFPLAFERLHEIYGTGDLAVVHACGSIHPTRSHFDAMHFMETGETRTGVETGWLGRHLAASVAGQEQALLGAVGIGIGLQRTLIGAPSAVALGEDPVSYGLAQLPEDGLFHRTELEELYQDTLPMLSNPTQQAFRTLDLLERIGIGDYRPAGQADYPASELATPCAARPR
jgi:uncharacterized protein (DUF1501 family)